MIYNRLTSLRHRVPLLFWSLCVLLLFEFGGILVLPLFVSRTQYLSWYLGSQSIDATRRFLYGDAYLVPDKFAGWRNRPNVAIGNWIIDAYGARSTHLILGVSAQSSRIMVLGSSMINGGTNIKNDETISAYLEDADEEVLNFGTMMYSVDQCLRAYQHDLHKYGAKVVLVGLDTLSAEGLRNHYIPFRMRDEKNMPYIKPRYELANGGLRLIPVEPEVQLAHVPKSTELLDFLKQNDQFYHNFSDYCRMDFSPLAASSNFLCNKLVNLYRRFLPDKERGDLLLTVMKEMESVAREHGAQVIFIMLPQQKDFVHRGIRRFLPDVYSRSFNIIESRGFDVIDGRQALLNSGEPLDQLFQVDGIHYKPLANRLVAQAIRVKGLPKYPVEK